MAAPPAELFALRLDPGEPISLDPDRDFVITNICFAANEDEEDEEDEEFTPGETTIVKLHHIPADEPFGIDDSDDEFSDQDDDDEDDEGEDEDDEEEDEEAEEHDTKGETAGKKVNGSSKKDMEDDEDDEPDEDDQDSDDDSDDLPDVEEKIFSVARLTTGRIEQITVNLQVCAEELVAFSLGGKNPRPVDLIGSYLAPQNDYNMEPDSDDEALLDSDDDEESEEYSVSDLKALKALLDAEEEDDEEEDDEDFEEGDEEEDSDPEMQEFSDDEAAAIIDHAELAALLAGEDYEEEDEEEDRFEEINAAGEAEKSKKGKKRPAEDGDLSMADASSKSIDAPVTEAELLSAAAAEGIDIASLNKNQRKRLNKKLKAQGGNAVPAPGAGEKEEAAPAATAQKQKEDVPAKTKKVEATNGKPAAASPAAAAPVAAEKPSASKAGSKKTTLASGLIVEEKKTGAGPQAKPGNKVQMRYIGRFKDGKIFDQNTKGAPFTFRLGKGEVIAGWDEGVKGMQAGSERRLTVPPKLGYGSKKTGPIPPNSTLYFDVKLVGIK